MIELFCAIIDDIPGAAFSVRVDEGDTVDDLKKAIKDEKPNDLKHVDADNLRLFLAKKGDAWLPDDENLHAVLQGRDFSSYLEMRPSWKLVKPSLFGPNVSLGEDVIHMLVVVPDGAVGLASETSKLDQLSEKFDKMSDKLDKSVLGKRRVCHSSASSSLLDDLHVRLRASRAVAFETDKQVKPFTWEYIVDERGQKIKPTEEQQRKRYREYVRVNIGDALAKNKLCVYGVEKGEEVKDVLSVDVPGHNIELVGRTDMIILSDQVLENPLELKMLPDVRLIIEVKQKVEGPSVSQAVSELIALDILAAEPVMALLTDLQKHWQFFWVADPTNDRGTIESVTIRDPSKAFAMIKTLLSSAGAVVNLPCFQEPIKRLKISGVLASIGESGGTSIRESIERYYDIASILGPDMDMARAVARQITRSIPTLRYIS